MYGGGCFMWSRLMPGNEWKSRKEKEVTLEIEVRKIRVLIIFILGGAFPSCIFYNKKWVRLIFHLCQNEINYCFI
jgi:hypothetical protein